jgi:hypothetical protein
VLGVRDTPPVRSVRLTTCDRCGDHAFTQSVNDGQAKRWCLPCIALPPEPRELAVPEPIIEVARGSRP